MTRPECVQMHLGDGAYATVHKDFIGQVIITGNHHDPDLASDKVYLDAKGIETLHNVLQASMQGS